MVRAKAEDSRRREMRNLGIVAVLLCGGVAWGQAADKKAPEAAKPAAAEGKPAAEAKPPGGEMAMKPDPALQQYKGMIGNWKCEGKGSMMGKELKMTGTYKAAWDLDNYWLVAHFEGKAQGMPGSHKGMDIYGYDPASKMYVVTGVDNMGGWSMAKSKGWEGDKQEWAGQGNMMGKQSDVKWTVTRKGDKEVTLSGSMGTDTWEETCKK
jgi:hypothetical protein